MHAFKDINTLLPQLFCARVDMPVADPIQQQVQQVFIEEFSQSANYLKPLLFGSGRLLIIANAPIWATHIRHRQQTIRDRCADQGITLGEIKVKVIPVSEQPLSDRQAPRDKPKLKNQTVAQIERSALMLKSPSLQKAFSRLAKRLSSD